MGLIISIFLTLIPSLLILIIATFSILLIRTYSGKSIRDRSRPPVKGTVFHQLRYISWLFDHHAEVTREHPTFRLLAPDQSEIFTADVQNVEHMLKTSFEKYQKGEYGIEICGDLLGHGIFLVNGDKWLHQRKLASVEFSARVLRDFSCGVFRKNAARLVQKISGFSMENKTFDIMDLLMKSAMDSTSRVAFGEDLNCLDGSSPEAIEFMEAVEGAHEVVCWRFFDPLWKLKRALNICSEAALKQHIKVIDTFVHGVITRKKELLQQGQKSPSDFLQLQLKKQDILSRFILGCKVHEDSNDPDDEMSDQYLRDVFINFMFAGKDSTGHTLGWFIYMLCKNPSVQERILQEVEQVIIAAGSVQKTDIESFVDLVTDEALEKMHYLHAALTETLRLYPAVPIDGRMAVEDDVLPDGYKVNKGDNLYYVGYAMGRMPYIWGDQAQEFCPERWLDQNGIFKPESQFKFVAFHGGPRSCLGKDFAYRQMKITSAALIHFFRFEMADNTRKITYKIMFNLQINGSLNVNALPRGVALAL